MSSLPPSPVFPAPAAATGSSAPFSARLVSNEMGSIRLGGSGRPVPIARRVLRSGNDVASSNEVAELAAASSPTSPAIQIGRRLNPSTRISLDSTASDISERFRVRRIIPRRSSTSLGTMASTDAMHTGIQSRPQPAPTRARAERQTQLASTPPVAALDATGGSDQRSERSSQLEIKRTFPRTRVKNHTIPASKPSTNGDGRAEQSVRIDDSRSRRPTSLSVSTVRKRTLPRTRVSSPTGGERKQPPVRTTSASADQRSALPMESKSSIHDEAQATTHASPTRDYSKLPPELLKHYTHHIKHRDPAQPPAVSFVSRVDAATGALSPIAPWRLLDERIDHIYEDPSIDMVQLNLFHPFAANDKERKLAERERLLRAASELRQRELKQKRENDVLKERKDQIQQMSEAIRSRNRQVAMTNRTQSPSPAAREAASAIIARRREDLVPKRKPPVPRLSGTSKPGKRQALRKTAVSDVAGSKPSLAPEASKVASGSESGGDDTVQPSVTGTILLGDHHAFGDMPHPDVTQSVLLHTDEEASERDTRDPALNQSARSGRGKARARRKNKLRKDTDAAVPRPETLQRRALAREFMILQKQSRQFEREKLKQQNEMEQEKRRRQMEELERRRLLNLWQTTRRKKRQLKNEETKISTQAPSVDDKPTHQLQLDGRFPTVNENDLQSDPIDISDTENDRGRANITDAAPSPSKTMDSSTSDVDGFPEPAKEEEDPAIVDARLRKLLDLEEKAKSLMAKLHGLTKRKDSVKEPAVAMARRNYTEKQLEIEEPDIDSIPQDDEMAESEREDDGEGDHESFALTSAMDQDYEDRVSEGSQQESESSEQADDSDEDTESNKNYGSTQLDIVQGGDYEFANRMSRLSPYEIQAQRFNEDIDPDLDPRNIGVHRIDVVFARERLHEEESISDKSDEIRRARSHSVASSSDSDSDHSTRRSQASRHRTLEESLEQYMTHLCVREGSSRQSRTGSHSSDGNASSDHTMKKERSTANSSAYTQQLSVRHARVDIQDDRLRQLFLQEDDSLSVIHSTALKLLTENKEQRRLKLERERLEVEDMEALRQQERDRQLETVMASILGQVESEQGDDSDHTSEKLVMDDASETGNAPFVTLEQIMEAVERERRQEREQNQREADESAMDYDKSVHEQPKMSWNDMLSTGEPLERKLPRVAIDTSELILQRHQQEDEATSGGIDEQPRLLHSPQSLAKRLLAEVELHDAIHDAHLQISLMEHSRAIEQVQRETVMMASAFKEEMENNFSTHQVALQHATLEKKFDSDLQDVMQKLQDIHEFEQQEKQKAALEAERALKQARLQEFGAQTEPPTKVDAATYAPIRMDTGTATVVYVDTGVQWDCANDDTKSKTAPIDASQQSEYEHSESNTEAMAATATGDDYDDEMFESEAEKADGSKQSASSVETAVDAGEEDEEEEAYDEDSIAYSETQHSRSDMPVDAVVLSDHDEVEEIESQPSEEEDADVQSDIRSISSESENVRSHEAENVISSQHEEEMQDEVQSEPTEGDDEIESEHGSVISESQMDHHERDSVQSEHELNDQAGSMSYDDDFEASSPRAKQMPIETVDEPEESDIMDGESDTEANENDTVAEESQDYSDDCASSHSSSSLKNKIPDKTIRLAEANSQKQTVQSTIASSSLLDRAPVSLRMEESRPRIMIPESNSTDAQSYMKDLEVRRQTEESLLQFRLHALEVRLQHELEQLETTTGNGTHWVNELLLRREALNMNFLAEKANVESLKAANMARYYQDLLAFQALTNYELQGGGAPATFAAPASFVTSPRVMLVTHHPPSGLAPEVTSTSPPAPVSIQPEEQSGQASDQYRDDDFASEDGYEKSSQYSIDEEQKKNASVSVLSVGSEVEEEDGSSKMGEDIVSSHDEEEEEKDRLNDDIASEKDGEEESVMETNVITENEEEDENLSDDIESEHDGDQVEDDPTQSAVEEIDAVPESAVSEEDDDYAEDDYAEDDFASASTAEDVPEQPQTLEEEEASIANEDAIASADDAEGSIEDDRDDDQGVAEDEDIQMDTEVDVSIVEAEFPDEASDAVDASAEDYGDEVFESEASHSVAVKSDESKHSIASDDVASSVEMDAGSKQEIQVDEIAEMDSIAQTEAENEISSVHENENGSLLDPHEANDIESEHSQGEVESDDGADGNKPPSETGDVDEDDIASEAGASGIGSVEDAYEEEDFESASAIDAPVVVVSSVTADEEESERVYEDEFEGSDLETREAEVAEGSIAAKTHEDDGYAAYSDEEFEAGSDIGSAAELDHDAAAATPTENPSMLELLHSTDNAQSVVMIYPPDGTNLLQLHEKTSVSAEATISLLPLNDQTEDVELSQDLSTVLLPNEEKPGELSELNANSVQAVSLSGSDSEEILTKSIENHLKRLKEIEQQILDRRQEMKQIEKQQKVERRREDLCNKERDLCQEMERVETQLRLEQAHLELARHRNRLEVEHLATKQQKLKGKSWQPDLLSMFDYVEVVEFEEPREHIDMVMRVPTPDSELISHNMEQVDQQDGIANAHNDVKDVEQPTSLDLLEEYAFTEDAESVDSDQFDAREAPPTEACSESIMADTSIIDVGSTDVHIEQEEQSRTVKADEIPVRARPSLSLSHSRDLLASFDYIEDVEEPAEYPSQDLLAQFDFVEEVELLEPELLNQEQTPAAGETTSSTNHEIDSSDDHSIAESNEMEPYAHFSKAEEYDECEPDEQQFCANSSAALVDKSASTINGLDMEADIEASASTVSDHEEELRIQQVDRITELIYHDVLTALDEGVRIEMHLSEPVTLEETELLALGHRQQEADAYCSAEGDKSLDCDSNLNQKCGDDAEDELGEESAAAIAQQPNDTTAHDAVYARIADSLFTDVYEEILASGMQGRHQTPAQSKPEARSTAPVVQVKQPAAIETPTMSKRCMDCAHAILAELSLTDDGQIHLPTSAKDSSEDPHTAMVYDVIAELLADGFGPQSNGGSLEECRSIVLREIETLLMVQRLGQDDLEHQIRRVFTAEGESHSDDRAETGVEEAHIKAQIRSSVSTAARTMECRLLVPTAPRTLPTKNSELRRPRKTGAMATAITQELDNLQDRIANSIYQDLLTQL